MATHQTKNKSLPERGLKKLRPEDVILASTSKQKDITTKKTKIEKHLEHKSLFQANLPRSARSVAEWHPEINKAVVIKPIKKMFEFFGTQTKINLTLNPEEALYLLESNNLELQWNNLPLSVMQAYAVILNGFDPYCELRYYKLYSYFLRNCCRLLRHQKRTANENVVLPKRPLEDEHISCKKLKSDTEISSDTKNEFRSQNDAQLIINKLNLFKPNRSKITEVDCLNIVYDGYHESNKSFCKSKPPDPDFCVFMAEITDIMPTPNQLKSSKQNNETLVHAIYNAKDISLFVVENVFLPNLNDEHFNKCDKFS